MIKFEFTKKDFEEFKEKCMLNDELSAILEYRIKNYSLTKIATLMNMSESSVSRRIKKLDEKIRKII